MTRKSREASESRTIERLVPVEPSGDKLELKQYTARARAREDASLIMAEEDVLCRQKIIDSMPIKHV